MNSIKSAPTDKPVRLHMPDGSSFRGELQPFIGENDEDVFGWVCLDPDQAPLDWTDDVCWSVNADGKKSTRPVGWSPIVESKEAD